mmetsp:Transcript_1816/g.4724  ORF Transcript_1816/g.4724 Transcript_1816/m.4724 type:complete len:201 (-) Transcript_1816:174-776(-)
MSVIRPPGPEATSSCWPPAICSVMSWLAEIGADMAALPLIMTGSMAGIWAGIWAGICGVICASCDSEPVRGGGGLPALGDAPNPGPVLVTEPTAAVRAPASARGLGVTCPPRSRSFCSSACAALAVCCGCCAPVLLGPASPACLATSALLSTPPRSSPGFSDTPALVAGSSSPTPDASGAAAPSSGFTACLLLGTPSFHW